MRHWIILVSCCYIDVAANSIGSEPMNRPLIFAVLLLGYSGRWFRTRSGHSARNYGRGRRVLQVRSLGRRDFSHRFGRSQFDRHWYIPPDITSMGIESLMSSTSISSIDVQNEALTLAQDPPVEEARAGERLRWNCTFGQSRPQAHITWLVNGEPVSK